MPTTFQKGEDWEAQIRRGIELADHIVVALSPDSIGSPECSKEIDYTLANHKRLLPVVLRQVAYADVRAEVRRINFIILGQRELDGLTEDIVHAIDTDVQHAQAHTRLLAKALDWDARGRSRGFLIRGDQLADAERWLSESPDRGEPSPTTLQTEFIRASRTAATRFMRNLFAGITTFLVVALVLTALALAQRSQRLKALQAENLSFQAQRFAAVDPTLAFDLARQAYAVNQDNKDAEPLLRNLYHESNARAFYVVIEPDSDEYEESLATFGGDPSRQYAARLPNPVPTLFAARLLPPP